MKLWILIIFLHGCGSNSYSEKVWLWAVLMIHEKSLASTLTELSCSWRCTGCVYPMKGWWNLQDQFSLFNLHFSWIKVYPASTVKRRYDIRSRIDVILAKKLRKNWHLRSQLLLETDIFHHILQASVSQFADHSTNPAVARSLHIMLQR